MRVLVLTVSKLLSLSGTVSPSIYATPGCYRDSETLGKHVDFVPGQGGMALDQGVPDSSRLPHTVPC